jgi:hypothetical protein
MREVVLDTKPPASILRTDIGCSECAVEIVHKA